MVSRWTGTSWGRQQSTGGFTLIELLVVLAVISLLLSLAVPRYYGQLQAAKETVLRENLRQLREITQRFYGDTGRYPESLRELVDRRYLLRLPEDPVTESSQTWIIVPPPAGLPGQVYDLRSGAPGEDSDGRPYATL